MTDTRPFRTILYDLDGTLVDHFTAIYHSYTYALGQLGLEPASFDKVKATVGGSVPVTMARLIGDDLAAEAVRHFEVYLAEHMFDGLHPLPGASWLLQALHQQGYQQAVFTNKTGSAARMVCTHLGFAPWLDAVVGPGDTPWRKPQPEFSRHIIDSLKATPAATLMIGDSPFDLEAGAVVGMHCAAVCTGSHDRDQLNACGQPSIGIFDDLYELGHNLFALTPPRRREPMPTVSP